VTDNWRVVVRFPERSLLEAFRSRLAEARVTQEVREQMGRRVVVTHDKSTLFAYTETEGAAREVMRLIRDVLDKDGIDGEETLTRWHPDAEDWESPEAQSDPVAEHERLQERERSESRERGWPEWEVRAQCPDHHSAGELASRLREEGLPVARGWSVVVLGAETEDDAKQLAERIRKEAPPGTDVDAEGSLAYVEANEPFSWVANMPLAGGGL
jgi:hypothetical protein